MALLERAGFEIAVSSTDWVPKEISVLARPRRNGAPISSMTREEPPAAGLRWLLDVRAAAHKAQKGTGGLPFGLFGSSIAATWLASELAEPPAFFVDEDPNRRGFTFMGRPILTPAEVSAGAHVFVPLGGGLAATVAHHLSESVPHVRWHAAPPLAKP